MVNEHVTNLTISKWGQPVCTWAPFGYLDPCRLIRSTSQDSGIVEEVVARQAGARRHHQCPPIARVGPFYSAREGRGSWAE